ncbi:hypothetical protein CSUI_005496 [Cystoisospora suis]|uniref:Uncharacterized protein n=1 Tax=Cystoisospora suis TaxID=483139 RepID=A0A2C6KXQ5_9APIC|nr:hypothetical protein CSUI_005496 [Cystoisospora suis]
MKGVTRFNPQYGDPGRQEIGARLVSSQNAHNTSPNNAVYVHPQAPRTSPSFLSQSQVKHYVVPTSLTSPQNGLVSNSHAHHPLHISADKDTIESCILSAASTVSLSSPSNCPQHNQHHAPTSMDTSLDNFQRNDVALKPLPRPPSKSSLSSSFRASQPVSLPSIGTPDRDLPLSTYRHLHHQQSHSHPCPIPNFACDSVLPRLQHPSTPSFSKSSSSCTPSFSADFRPCSVIIPSKEETSSFSSRPSLSDPEASSSLVTTYSFCCPSFRSGDYRIPSGGAGSHNSYQPSTSSSSCVSSDAFDLNSHNRSRRSSSCQEEQETSLTSFKHPSLGQSTEETSSPISFESLTHHIPPLYAHAQLSDYGIRTPGEQLQQDLLRGRCQGGGCEREESHLKKRNEPSNASFLFSSSPSHYHDESKKGSSFNPVNSSHRAQGSTTTNTRTSSSSVHQTGNRYSPRRAANHEKKSSSSSVPDQSLIYRWIPKVITSIFDKKTEDEEDTSSDRDADDSNSDEGVKERELMEKRDKSHKESSVEPTSSSYSHQAGETRRTYHQGRGVEGEQGMKNKQQERERNHVYVWKEKTKENEVIQQDDITNSLCSHNQETSPTTTRPFSFAYDETLESRMENTRLCPTMQETLPHVSPLPQLSSSASSVESSLPPSICRDARPKKEGEKSFLHATRKNDDDDGLILPEKVPLPPDPPSQEDLDCRRDLIYRFWPFHGVSPSKLPADCPPPPPHHRYPNEQTPQAGHFDVHQKIEEERSQISAISQPSQNNSFYEGSFYPSRVETNLHTKEVRSDEGEKEGQVGEENPFTLRCQMNHHHENLHAQEDACSTEGVEDKGRQGGEELEDTKKVEVEQEMDMAFSEQQQQLGRPSTPKFAGGESPLATHQTEEADLGKGNPLVGEGEEDTCEFEMYAQLHPASSHISSYQGGEMSSGAPARSNTGPHQDNRHHHQPDQPHLQVDTFGTIPVTSTGVYPSPLPLLVVEQKEKMTKNEEAKESLGNVTMDCICPQKDTNVLLPSPLPMENVRQQEQVDPYSVSPCLSLNLSCPVLTENERLQKSVPLQKHQDQKRNEPPLRDDNPWTQNREECLSSLPDMSSSSSPYTRDRKDSNNRVQAIFEDCLDVVMSNLPAIYSTSKHATGMSHDELHPSLGSSYQTKNEMTMRSETLANSTEDMKVSRESHKDGEKKEEEQAVVQKKEKNYPSTKIENDMNSLHSPAKSPGSDINKYKNTPVAYVPKADASKQPIVLHHSPSVDSQKNNSIPEVNPAVPRRKQQLLRITESQERAEKEEDHTTRRGKGEEEEIRVSHQPEQAQEPGEISPPPPQPILLKKNIERLLLRNKQVKAILKDIKKSADAACRAGIEHQEKEKEKDEDMEKENTGGEQRVEELGRWDEPLERKTLPKTSGQDIKNDGNARFYFACVPTSNDSKQPIRLHPSPNVDSQKNTNEVNPAVLRRKQQLLRITESQERAEEEEGQGDQEARRGKGEEEGIRVSQPEQTQEPGEISPSPPPVVPKTNLDRLLLRNKQVKAILEGIKSDIDAACISEIQYQEEEKAKDEDIEKENTRGEQRVEELGRWDEPFERKLLSTGEYALCKQCDGMIKLSERKQERDRPSGTASPRLQHSHNAPRSKNEESEEEGVFCRCSSSLPSFSHSQSHPDYPAKHMYEDSINYTNTHQALPSAPSDERRKSSTASSSSVNFDSRKGTRSKNEKAAMKKNLHDERPEREMPRIHQEKQVVYGDHNRNEKEKADLSFKVHRDSRDIRDLYDRRRCHTKKEDDDEENEQVQGRQESEEKKFLTRNSGSRGKKTSEVLPEKKASHHGELPSEKSVNDANEKKDKRPSTTSMKKMTEEKGVGTSHSDIRRRNRTRYPSPSLIKRNRGEGLEGTQHARHLPSGRKANQDDERENARGEERMKEEEAFPCTHPRKAQVEVGEYNYHHQHHRQEEEEKKTRRGRWMNDKVKNQRKTDDHDDVDVFDLTTDEAGEEVNDKEDLYSRRIRTREGRHCSSRKRRTPPSSVASPSPPGSTRSNYTKSHQTSTYARGNSPGIPPRFSSTSSPKPSPSLPTAHDEPRGRHSHNRSRSNSHSHSTSPRGPRTRMISPSSSSSSPSRKEFSPGSAKIHHLHPTREQPRGYGSCDLSPRCQQQGLMSTLNFNRTDAAELAAEAWPGENAGDAWRIQEKRRKQELPWTIERKELQDLVEEQQSKLDRLLEEREKRQKEEEEQQNFLFLHQHYQRELENLLYRSGTSGSRGKGEVGGGLVWRKSESGCPLLVLGGEERDPIDVFKELLYHVFPGQTVDEMMATAKAAVDETKKHPSRYETHPLILRFRHFLRQMQSGERHLHSISRSYSKGKHSDRSHYSSTSASRIHEYEGMKNEPHEHHPRTSRCSRKDEANYMKKKNEEEESRSEAEEDDETDEDDEYYNYTENSEEEEDHDEEDIEEQEEESEESEAEEDDRKRRAKYARKIAAYARYLREYYDVPWSVDSDDTETYLNHQRHEKFIARTNGVAVRHVRHRRDSTEGGAGSPGGAARAGVNEGMASSLHHLNNSSNASETNASRKGSVPRGYSNVSSGVSTAASSQVHPAGVKKVQQSVEEGMPVHPYIKATRSVVTRPMPWDTIDQALADLHNSHSGQQSWKKINRGIYKYGDVQVTLAFIGDRLTAQQDDKNEDIRLLWNKGARGDVLKFIGFRDSKRAEQMAKLQQRTRRSQEDF